MVAGKTLLINGGCQNSAATRKCCLEDYFEKGHNSSNRPVRACPTTWYKIESYIMIVVIKIMKLWYDNK